jgi:drug/metabolite transporter (DMT)-like permease
MVVMTINDLPAIMGTVLVVAGLVLVGIFTAFRSERSEKSVQAGALLIVVGAVLLGLSLFVPHSR